MLVTGGSRYVAEDNTLQRNDAGYGGGFFVYSSTGTIAHNQVVNNTANTAGGGIYLYTNAGPTVDANAVLSNTAAVGGGVYILNGTTPITLTNQIIAHGGAGSVGGAGMYVNASQGVRLLNNTLVDNTRGSNREGVRLTGNSRVTMTNNLIVGHSVGITVTAGSVAVLTRNDYWDNAVAVGGQSNGPTDMALDPQLENRAASDYHLSLNSPVVDQGDNGVNVPYDFEGDPRPRGARMDVGADEAYRADSYVSQATGSDLTGTGSSTQPFATVTRGITETRSGGTVYVGRGTYTERITITRSVNLFGGYRETDWTRNIAVYNTTLDAQRTGTVVAIQGDRVWGVVEGFTITGGEGSVYGSGGGVAVIDDAAAAVRYNAITGNHARSSGGGLLLWGNESLESIIESNRIYNNVADGMFEPFAASQGAIGPQQGAEPGGGLMVAGLVRVVNNWVCGNSAGAGGDGMALMSGDTGPIYAYHNTVADNGAVGIQLGWGEIYLYNNLIVGQQTGIHVFETTHAIWDYNGFYDNDTPYGPGLTSGAHDVMGDPGFANRPARDYHIGLASPMAGAGTDVGVTADLDGDVRPAPVGTRPDIGADEVRQQRTYLPLALK